MDFSQTVVATADLAALLVVDLTTAAALLAVDLTAPASDVSRTAAHGW
jgi:hypothetical protein